MLNDLKEKAIAKGMSLLSSPMVTKAMESEKVGIVLEKAMSLPIKVSDEIRTKKEKITSFMELATQADLDDIKRAVARVEDELNAMKNDSNESDSQE